MRSLLALSVAALAAMALFPLTGCVDGAGDDGLTEAIVFMSESPYTATQTRIGTPWVWLMTADGSVRVPVNDSGLTINGNCMGALSPDGTNIVYADYFDSGILRFDLATGESTVLNDTEYDTVTPVYSPDGGTILFSADGPNINSTALFTMSPDGSNSTVLRSVDDEEYSNPRYNWTGTKIVMQTSYNSDIAIIDADGSNFLDLTTGDSSIHPSFLPDDRIIYTRNMGDGIFDLWIMDADGGNKRNLTNTPSTSESSPSSNAAGTQIAYAVGNRDGGDIYVAPFDGTNLGTPVNITANVADPCWRPTFGRVRTDLLDALFAPQ